MHELMHVLGFYHEHSRFDRDQYVSINYDNVQKDRLRQFEKRAAERVDAIGGYDFGSIMHYEQNAFAVDKQSPTIVPRVTRQVRDGAIDDTKQMGQRVRLSESDIQKVNEYYNCPVKPPTYVATPVPNAVGDLRDAGPHFNAVHSYPTNGVMPRGVRPQPVNHISDPMAYPRSIQCAQPEETNCMDRMDDCLQRALKGECDKKPGLMLRMCRRSCCNCNDRKCFDTKDERKYNTLCMGRSHYAGIEMVSSCEVPSTRQNALDYCPNTCGTCVLPLSNAVN